jgi:CRP-like cAMP-binding protein
MTSLPEPLLSAFPLLSECGATEIATLSRRLRVRTLDAGETVLREGDPPTEFALVLTGRLTITRAMGQEPEFLGVAGPGAILGELALLRAGPRNATVTAEVPSEIAVGDVADLEYLLQLPGVHDRVRDLASARLAQDVRPVPTTLPDGTKLLLRPLLPSDRAAYEAAIERMSPASLRRRFFTTSKPSTRLVEYLLFVDYVDHFVWLALLDENPSVPIATARYIRPAHDADEAEVAFAVVDAYQGRGIGQLLLGAVGVAASAAGIDHLVAEVLEDNTPMRAVLEKAGVDFAFAEPGVVRGRLLAVTAAELLAPALRNEIHRASRDVVTAAGLALT